MELKELKQYIYDNQKVEFVLNEIGCHHVKYHQKGILHVVIIMEII